MKNSFLLTRLQALLRCGTFILALLPAAVPATPLGTAFTYQGRLHDGGSPATGSYDLRFSLYDALAGGSLVGTPTTLTVVPVGITNGLFAVTLDFGGTAFAGDARWLQIEVRTNGSLSAHTLLSPRQLLTPTPHALYSMNAGSATTAAGVSDGAVTTSALADNAITAVKIGSGQVVKSLNGFPDNVILSAGSNVAITALGPGNIEISALPSGWSLAGNAGTTAANFLGTTDNRPLEFKVDGARALRLEPHDASPNLIGGSLLNAVTAGARGVTIGGGGDFIFGDVLWNNVTDDFGTVAGGLANTAGNSSGSTGDAKFATVGGGTHNTASGLGATVPGGNYNRAAGTASLAAGQRAKADHNGGFVWADSTSGDFASTAENQFLIRAGGGVGVGTATPVAALDVRDGSGALGQGGRVHVGGTGANGDAKLIQFGDGDFVHIGESGSDDTLEIKATRMFFNVPGFIGIGTATPTTKLDVVGEARVQVLTITGGADIAEPFPMSSDTIPEGAVVIIDEAHPGKLKRSERAYDTCVAGIVSGANGIKAGLSLRQEGVLEGGQNVALSGRVYVMADACGGAIKPGDLLTTSPTPGHAMKVTEHARAQGAILGKAMGALETGRGLILVLVSLQ